MNYPKMGKFRSSDCGYMDKCL